MNMLGGVSSHPSERVGDQLPSARRGCRRRDGSPAAPPAPDARGGGGRATRTGPGRSSGSTGGSAAAHAASSRSGRARRARSFLRPDRPAGRSIARPSSCRTPTRRPGRASRRRRATVTRPRRRATDCCGSRRRVPSTPRRMGYGVTRSRTSRTGASVDHPLTPRSSVGLRADWLVVQVTCGHAPVTEVSQNRRPGDATGRTRDRTARGTDTRRGHGPNAAANPGSTSTSSSP